MRLCSNTGFNLHLIKPLGFNLDERSLKRAQLDYQTKTKPVIFENIGSYCSSIKEENIIIITKFGKKIYTRANYTKDSTIIFGSEVHGLPKHFIKRLEKYTYKIPMIKGSRSLNLSNAVSIVSCEAWKKLNFCGEHN